MKKNTIKAFTLVEMLIVIVIIWILIASLMPRMQSAQWRARDVARKNDLAQIQTAIITSQQDKWFWPGGTAAESWMAIAWDLATALQDAWMTQVPTDPNKSNVVKWLNGQPLADWTYGYMVTTRNSLKNGWFILMAKTEVEWSSNWLVCDAASGTTDENKLTKYWIFTKGIDLKNVQTCSSFKKVAAGTSGDTCYMSGGECHYTDQWQLAYILVY